MHLEGILIRKIAPHVKKYMKYIQSIAFSTILDMYKIIFCHTFYPFNSILKNMYEFAWKWISLRLS